MQTLETMKSKTKKILLTQKGEVNKSIQKMISNCRFADGLIYTGYYLGRGRFTSRHSAQSTIISILEAQGYKYTTGNNLPSKGANGEYVKSSKIAVEFIKTLV
jgi:hypothetical protein